MPAPFVHYLRVRYAECDAQKVVFNSRYADYVDVAVTEFVRALGFGAEAAAGALDYQLVKQTVEWKASAAFDQVLAITVAPLHLGNTSFSLRSEFRIAGDDRLIASVETVYVMVDESLVKKPLPEPFRSALALGAPGMVSDHAGYLSGRFLSEKTPID